MVSVVSLYTLKHRATNKNLRQVLVRNIGQLGAVELGNHELEYSPVSTGPGEELHVKGIQAHSMALGKSTDVEKSERLLTLKELEAGDFTCRAVLDIISAGQQETPPSAVKYP